MNHNKNVTASIASKKSKNKQRNDSEGFFTDEAPVHMYCQCLADPNGTHGCQMPDTIVAASTPAKYVSEYTLDSNANGDIAFTISPSVVRERYTHVVTAGAVASTTYTASPDYTGITAACEYGRLVVYEVQVNYIGSAQLASGRFAMVADSSLNNLAVGVPLDTLFDDGTSVPATEGIFTIARPKGLPEYDLLTDPTFGVPHFDYIHFVAKGLPISAAGVVSVRLIKHVEVLPMKGSVWRGSVSVEPYHPGAVAQAANMGHVGAAGSLIKRPGLVADAIQTAKHAWNYVQPEVQKGKAAAMTALSVYAKGKLMELLAAAAA